MYYFLFSCTDKRISFLVLISRKIISSPVSLSL
uniref:Uncharacterized protein n=1 Tax=Populus trichocarpa TaxID=3694 RepID=A0A3N7FEN0_POPTR